MGKTKRADKRFLKMGKLGKQMLKLSKKNGLDITSLVLRPDHSIEVNLSGDFCPVVKGFGQ